MTTISIENIVKAPVEKVWEFWTSPKHIIKWYNASDDWHTPHAENDLQAGGKFLFRMEARDASMGFDFEGVYDAVIVNELIEYRIADGRRVKITFLRIGSETKIIESFEAESINSIELQRGGWKAILDNFKKYIEES